MATRKIDDLLTIRECYGIWEYDYRLRRVGSHAHIGAVKFSGMGVGKYCIVMPSFWAISTELVRSSSSPACVGSAMIATRQVAA